MERSGLEIWMEAIQTLGTDYVRWNENSASKQ
jgi:hypothetical protein